MLEKPTGHRRLLGGFCVCFALWLVCSQSAAQISATRKATAEALFERGKARMKEQKFAEAAALLEQSQAMDPGVGTRLFLAYCYEHLGRFASAWAMFREAASAASEKGEVERAQTGLERAAALEPQVPHVILQVTRPTAPGMTVRLNGIELAEATWDVPLPVDPGESRIELRAPGHQSYSVSRVVAAGGAPITVALPALAALPEQAGTPQLAESPAALRVGPQPSAASESSARDPGSSRAWQIPTAIIAGGAGVVALGIGTYFGVRAISRNGAAEDRCPSGTSCFDATGVRYSEQANSAARLSNGFLLGGVLLAGAGVVLWLTAPSESSPRVSAQADGRSLRLHMTGTF